MNSYLFIAWVTRVEAVTTRGRRGDSKSLVTVDGCSSMVVCSENAEAAQDRFEKGLLDHANSDPEQSSVVIRKIFGAPIIDQLFTESGPVPLDWAKVYEQLATDLETSSADCDPGYWLDDYEVVRAGAGIESMRESLPEDIRSGLNWVADKQFFFQLSVLSPPAAANPPYEMENEKSQESTEQNLGEPSLSELRDQQATYPQLVDMEAAAVVRARNSVVAAWLWRNYAATTPLAKHAFRIDPVSNVAGSDETAVK